MFCIPNNSFVITNSFALLFPGRCQILKLTGSRKYPDENGAHGLGIFEYVSGSRKENLRYTSTENGYDLYYEQMADLRGWNIGT